MSYVPPHLRNSSSTTTTSAAAKSSSATDADRSKLSYSASSNSHSSAAPFSLFSHSNGSRWSSAAHSSANRAISPPDAVVPQWKPSERVLRMKPELLHSSTTEERLRSEFEKYGPVKRTKIIAYPWKKNCGFVEFEQESACQDALADMRFKDFPDKWQWKVCYAHTDDPGKSVEEEGAEEIDWLEELYGFPNHEPHSYLSSPSVDTQGLQKQMDELLSFSGTSAPSVNRDFFAEKGVLGQLARRFIKNLMEISGLSVREDAVGNIFGRWEGLRPELSAVATGSHIDAIPFSGEYDGVVGILGAIEAVNVLKRSGFTPKRSVEVIMFTSDEPRRFGITCLGSLLMTESHVVTQDLMHDGCYTPFPDISQSAGYSHNDTDITSYSAFVELNIEQGPFLNEGISIGILTDIIPPIRTVVVFQNKCHPRMRNRNGAARAAAMLALKLEAGHFGHDVATVELHTGSTNSFPNKSYLKIDIDGHKISSSLVICHELYLYAKSIAQNEGVILTEFRSVHPHLAALSKKSIVDAMEDSSKELNLTYKYVNSQAYNDSLFMASISPVGVIFIPCYKGYSQKLEEYLSEEISNGVKVLALTLAKLALQ